jgi:hypothetical protein
MLQKRITYANVTATLALVVALSGGAYAVATLPRNSVGTPQLKNDAVKTSKVDNRTLLFKDIKPGQVDASNVRRWGPVRMNVGDAPKTLVTFGGVRLRGECTENIGGPGVGDEEVEIHFEGVALAEHLSYRSYDGTGAPYDNDNDWGPGEGANWGDHVSEFFGKEVTPPTTFSATLVYPTGKGLLSQHAAVANHGSSDCLFLGRFEKI